MKKVFKYYAICWAVLFAVYNVVVFAVRPVLPMFVVNYDARFWTAWAFTAVTFIGQLFCAFIAFKAENINKMFLNIPVINESYTALIAMTAAGCVLMLISNCPAWVSVIVCVIILGFSIVSVIMAKAAADIVGDIDTKIKSQTLFIKSLTVDADSLLSRAKTEEIKAELKKVYEAVRYSDPMSNDALGSIETQITLKFNELSKAAEEGNIEAVKNVSEEVIVLVEDRNKKCKLLK